MDFLISQLEMKKENQNFIAFEERHTKERERGKESGK